MSKIALTPNASGTDTFTIAAPAGTGTDRTLTLPDETGTVLTSASDVTASQLPSGSQVLISEDTDGGTGISALEVTLPTGATYDHYILKIDGLYFSAASNDLISQLAVSGTYQTGASDYRFVGPAAQTAVAVNKNGSNSENRIRFGWYSSGNVSTEPSLLHVQIWNSMDSGSFTRVFGIFTGQTDGNETQTVLTGGFRANNEVNDKIKFYGHNGGNFNYASYQLYGVLA